MTRNARRRLLVGTGVALAVGVLLSAAFLWGLFSTAQLASTDFLFRARSERARATVIVGIDQRSYRELLPRYGPLSRWPRSVYAQALDALHQASPRLVALDILFDTPAQDDPVLAATIRRLGNVVLPVEAEGLEDRTVLGDRRFGAAVRSIPTISQAAAADGVVNVHVDDDGVVRSLPLLLPVGEERLPSLALTAVARYVRRPMVIDRPSTDGEVFGAGRTIPVLDGERLLINYLGPPSSPEQGGPFTIIPFIDVLEGRFDHQQVNDRLVLIGLTVHGRGELATPASGSVRMWGVEVIGHAIETILAQRYLVPASPGLTVALVFALSLGSALLVALWRPRYAVAGSLGLLAAYLLAAMVLVDNGLLLNLVYPPAGLLIGLAAALTYRVVFEQAEQRAVRGVMERYLAPSVSQWVLQDPERLRLGGETRVMTVLFSDVRGFTTISHALEPQTLVSLLNEYMTAMTEVVFRHDGVLDKYIGDAIMAFWNAPMDQPDHAERACSAALAMVEQLAMIQAGWERRGLPKLEIGVGINTGPMVVGNLGSRQRLAYTVLGDVVNVASRLEGLSKEYGARLVVGESTRQAAADAFVFRFLDVVAVQGRAEPLAVYEVVGRTGQVTAERAAHLERYERAVGLYRSRQFDEATRILAALTDEAPADGPSALYLRRSRQYATSPPPPDWDGVHIATRK